MGNSYCKSWCYERTVRNKKLKEPLMAPNKKSKSGHLKSSNKEDRLGLAKPLTLEEKAEEPTTSAESKLRDACEEKNVDFSALIPLILKVQVKSKDLTSFLRILAKYEAATEAYTFFFKHQYSEEDLAELVELNAYAGNISEAGSLATHVAYGKAPLQKRLSGMQQSEALFKRSPDTSFQAAACNDQISLLREQKLLEEQLEVPGKFIDCSLVETLANLIRYQAADSRSLITAKALCQKFNVSERRFWLILVNTMAESGQWLELKDILTHSRAPIPTSAVVRICMRYEKWKLAKELSKKLPTRGFADEERVKKMMQEVLHKLETIDVEETPAKQEGEASPKSGKKRGGGKKDALREAQEPPSPPSTKKSSHKAREKDPPSEPEEIAGKSGEEREGREALRKKSSRKKKTRKETQEDNEETEVSPRSNGERERERDSSSSLGKVKSPRGDKAEVAPTKSKRGKKASRKSKKQET